MFIGFEFEVIIEGLDGYFLNLMIRFNVSEIGIRYFMFFKWYSIKRYYYLWNIVNDLKLNLIVFGVNMYL